MRSFLGLRTGLLALLTAILAVIVVRGCVIGGNPPQEVGAETHGLIYAATTAAAGTGHVFAAGVAVYVKGIGNDARAPRQ